MSSIGENRNTLRILVPLDGSELAALALPIAETLSRQLSAELHLIEVIPSAIMPYVGGVTYVPPEVYQQLDLEQKLEAHRYLEQAAANARAQGISVQTHLEQGDVAASLLDFVDMSSINLIVMTTHGRTGLARFALGSITDRVVRGGAAPVLLIRSFPPQAHPRDLSRVLIPLDGSSFAEVPLFALVPLLAGKVLRTITLVRVADPRDGESGRQLCERYLNDVRHRLLERLVGCDCTVSTLVRSNANPAASIVSCSQDGECDLVLMATHGEAGIGRWAFGSNADRVLRDGKTPLLLMRPARAPA